MNMKVEKIDPVEIPVVITLTGVEAVRLQRILGNVNGFCPMTAFAGELWTELMKLGVPRGEDDWRCDKPLSFKRKDTP
jgi:hypothetical protein